MDLRDLLVQVKPLVDTLELDDEDHGVAGEYTFSVDADLPDELAVETVLDEFHDTVPVSNPGHFEYTVVDFDYQQLN